MEKAKAAGAAFGYALYDRVVDQIVVDLKAQRKPGFEPPLANDMMAYLDRFHDQRRALTDELAIVSEANGSVYGEEWRRAARERYIAEIEALVRQILNRMATVIATDTNSFAVAEASIAETVLHVVYPDDCRQPADFNADTRAIWRSLVDQAASAQGWNEAADGSLGYVGV